MQVLAFSVIVVVVVVCLCMYGSVVLLLLLFSLSCSSLRSRWCTLSFGRLMVILKLSCR